MPGGGNWEQRPRTGPGVLGWLDPRVRPRAGEVGRGQITTGPVCSVPA